MTEYFNQLTEAQGERLFLLIEECAEVQKAAAKVLRHGYQSNNNGALTEINREALAREMGDLLHAMNRLMEAHDVDGTAISFHASRKAENIKTWLHHQENAI